jgi:hypothetical protein
MLWREAEHESLTSVTWDEGRAEEAVTMIVAEAEHSVEDCVWPVHPKDQEMGGCPLTSLYLGSAGMVWALHSLGSRVDAEAMILRALARYRAEPDFGAMARAASLWMGEAGILVVAHLLGAGAGEEDRLRALIDQNREHSTWELMWGSPGTTIGARAAGLESDWRRSAQTLWETWDERSDLWTQNLYGQTAQILGPAHGFAGNVHALRGLVGDDELAARVANALQATAIVEDGLVNWPPSAEPPVGFEFPIRVQWCHGAPGILATLGELTPRDLAIGAGQLIWRAGPLRKGAGLCHGTAGNGFALLKLHELTGEALWLDRARSFAMHALGQVERERALTGRGRFTLWTGDAGVALFLRACREARAGVPTIDWW